jgi:hypothetical protein
MKAISSITIILLFLFLSVIQMSVSSCTKEVTRVDTLTVIKKDTITVIKKDTVTINKDTALTLQILTANPWKLQEYKGVVGGSNVYYLRGGTGNNVNYDNENIVFRADKTGTYYDNFNTPIPLTWDFADATNTKIIYTVQFISPGATVITWDNIVYKDRSLKYSQSWTQGTTNSHTYNVRIPK